MATITGTDGDDDIYPGAFIPAGDIPSTEDADVIFALEGNDIIRAAGGDDIIDAGPGMDWVDGGDGDDTIDGGSGDDTLLDGFGSNTISGGDGDDYVNNVNSATQGEPSVVYGGAGNDRIHIGSADEAFGQDGNDLFSGFGGMMDGGAGDDTFYGGPDASTIYGGPGNDIIYSNYAEEAHPDFPDDTAIDDISGGAGDDTIYVNVGDDIDAGAGADTLVLYTTPLAVGSPSTLFDGADDVDYAVYSLDTTQNVIFALSADVLVLGALHLRHIEAVNMLSGSGDDQLTGGDFTDALSGGAGNDVLDGGAGLDTLIGGAGDDVYVLDNLEPVSELAGEGTDEIRTTVGLTLPDNFENLTLLAGAGSINGAGNGLDNRIVGNEDDNYLLGGGGNDTLIGGGGYDILEVGSGQSVIYGEDETGGSGTGGGGASDAGIFFAENGVSYAQTTVPVTVSLKDGTGTNVASLVDIQDVYGATTQPNNLTGDDNSNLLVGGNMDDKLIGLGGNDRLRGLDGNDTIDGGTGGDVLEGNAGDDTLIAGEDLSSPIPESVSVDDARIIKELKDRFFRNHDDLFGGDGNDILGSVSTIVGPSLERDNFFGGRGNDTMFGGSKGIAFVGGPGDDVMTGGSASDHFRVFDGQVGDPTPDFANSLGFEDGGHDNLDGGAGVDWVDYQYVGTGGITVSLASGMASGGVDDVLRNIEGVVGSQFDDVIIGDDLQNSLIGFKGTNHLTGGGGDDIFSFGTFVNFAGQYTFIEDFVAGAGTDDKLQFLTRTQSLQSIMDNATQVGSDTVIKLAETYQITLVGVSKAALHPDDFLFRNPVAFEGGPGNDNLSVATATGSIESALNSRETDNTFLGHAGNDFIAGALGNDSMDGGAGIDTAIFAGGHAEYLTYTKVMGGIATTVVADSAGRDGADTLTGIEGLLFADSVVVHFGAQQNLTMNVDGQRFDDVVYRSVSTGQVIFQNMTAGAAVGFDAVTNPLSAEWAAIGTGDVSGDGKADVVIWNSSNGFVYSALPGASAAPTYGLVAGGIMGPYSALGVTDINGDGLTDLLVREANSGSIFWQNAADSAWAYVGINLGANWNYQGAGDVTGDGFSDVAIRDTSGLVYIADMANGQNSGYISLGNLTGYQVRTVADVNADGFADVVVQRESDGWTLWRNLSGTGLDWNVATNPVGTEWIVKDAADVDNDGAADLIFQHSTTGETLYRAMDNGVGTDWQVVSTPLGTEWVVV